VSRKVEPSVYKVKQMVVDIPPGAAKPMPEGAMKDPVKRGFYLCRPHRVLGEDDHRPPPRVVAHAGLAVAEATKRRTSLMGMASPNPPTIIVLMPTT